jgi:Zn-dependent protease with chaperone function
MIPESLAKCSCGGCGKAIQFPATGEGCVINCPHCGAPTRLVATGHERPREGATRLPRRPVSIAYKLSLVLVTAAVLLLPVIYLALIPLEIWGAHAYSYSARTLTAIGYRHLYSPRGDWIGLEMLIYLGLFFLVPAQILSLVKPFFAQRARRQRAVALDPALQPQVEAFVARICGIVGAPLPARTELDCKLNASVELRGRWGLFKNEMVLRLGLPLVAALNQRELAGVLAHEFGHFTQGFGLRMSYLIRGVNRWFERAVSERDALDFWLERMAEESSMQLQVLAHLALLAVAFARWLLKGLAKTGQAVSCLLLRQMEYDADSYEITLAGSAAFKATTRRLATLREALINANKEASATWYLGRHLPDNFPAYLLYHESRIPVAIRQAAEAKLARTKTGPFDSHPSDGDRMRRARETNEPGIFGEDKPATALFAHYDLVAREVTYFHYVEELGLDLDLGGANLRPTPVAPSSGGPETES